MTACPFAFRLRNGAALGSHSPFVFTDLLSISHPEMDLFHCHWPITTCSVSKREIWKPTKPSKAVPPNCSLTPARVAPDSCLECRHLPSRHVVSAILTHACWTPCTAWRSAQVSTTLQLRTAGRRPWLKRRIAGERLPLNSYLRTACHHLFFLHSCLFLYLPLSLLGLSSLLQAFLLPPNCLKQQVFSSAQRPQVIPS